MRILMYRWKAYNQYDLIENLRERGHIVDEIKGELINYEEDDGFSKRFNARLDEVSYDMVITINYFPLISDICLERDILYVSWCCDCPIATMYHESVFNKVNKIFCFDKINYLTFADMGALYITCRYVQLPKGLTDFFHRQTIWTNMNLMFPLSEACTEKILMMKYATISLIT